MKFKIFNLAFLMIILTSYANAQFRSSVGVGVLSGTGKIPEGAAEYSEQPVIGGWGVFLYPRYSFNENGSISAGVPLTLGLSGSTNSRTGGSLSFIADIPLTVDYNFGAGSSEDAESNFGGFLGAGFGYTYSNYTDEFYIPGAIDTYEQLKGSSYGPLLHGGIKAVIGEKVYFLRAFYKVGLEKAKFRTFGLSLGLDF